MNTTTQKISTNTSSSAAGTRVHSDLDDHSFKMKKSSSNKGSKARKSGKKDRHSKIKTAQGVRDRRMRLSLHIARRFFDLQDMLGFDKASETIDWLFSKSKKAIHQLSCSPNHVPQMNMSKKNKCQYSSKGGEKSEQKRKKVINITASEEEGEHVSGFKTAKTSVRNGIGTNHIAKELRDKARARARERTRKKMVMRCLEKSKYNLLPDQAYNNFLAQLGPAEYPNPLFEIGQESMRNTSGRDNIWTSQSSIGSHGTFGCYW